jgi:hypothetical protein
MPRRHKRLESRSSHAAPTHLASGDSVGTAEQTLAEAFIDHNVLPFDVSSRYHVPASRIDYVDAPEVLMNEAELTKSIDKSQSKLDPIIGFHDGVNSDRLMFLCTLVVVTYGIADSVGDWPNDLLWLMTDKALEQLLSQSARDALRPTSWRETDTRWLPSLFALVSWGILDHVPGGVGAQVRGFATYFEVAKSASSSRAITDCYSFNETCNKPKRAPLISAADLVTALSFFDRPHVAELDARHGFYNLNLPRPLRWWFAIVTKAGCFLPTRWPMGACPSSYTMQVTTWCNMLAFRKKPGSPVGDHFVFQSSARSDVPPAYIIVRNATSRRIVAILASYYDNAVIIAESHKTRASLVKRLVDNAEFCGLQLKDSPQGGKVSYFENAGAVLGVAYRRCNGRNGTIEWSHAKPERWQDVEEPKRQCTARELARVIGIALWDCTLRGHSPARHARLINILRKRRVHMLPRKWSSILQLNDEECELWSRTMSSILENTPEVASTVVKEPRPCHYLASDASDWGWGGVFLSEQGEVLDFVSVPWTEKDRNMCVYFREVKAAALTMYWFFKIEDKLKLPPADYRAVCDNAAGQVALSKFYSCMPQACDILERLRKKLVERDRVLTTIWCKSEDMAADEPSRKLGTKPSDERAKASASVLRNAVFLRSVLYQARQESQFGGGQTRPRHE